MVKAFTKGRNMSIIIRGERFDSLKAALQFYEIKKNNYYAVQRYFELDTAETIMVCLNYGIYGEEIETVKLSHYLHYLSSKYAKIQLISRSKSDALAQYQQDLYKGDMVEKEGKAKTPTQLPKAAAKPIITTAPVTEKKEEEMTQAFQNINSFVTNADFDVIGRHIVLFNNIKTLKELIDVLQPPQQIPIDAQSIEKIKDDLLPIHDLMQRTVEILNFLSEEEEYNE